MINTPSNLTDRALLAPLLAMLPAEARLEDIWALMDRTWDELGCDERQPDAASVAAFYRHPIWVLNGLFIEQDPTSLRHRQAIVAWLARQGSGPVLDYGGGFGSLGRMLAAQLPTWQVDLFEPFPNPMALERARAYANLRFIDNVSRRYSCVVCLDVLEHVADPLALFGAMVAATEPGGTLLIANHFYPSIKCHLPQTFHLRYSFRSLARSFGLHYLGPCVGSHAHIYRRVPGQAVNWPAIRVGAQISRACYPLLVVAHRAYQAARGHKVPL